MQFGNARLELRIFAPRLGQGILNGAIFFIAGLTGELFCAAFGLKESLQCIVHGWFDLLARGARHVDLGGDQYGKVRWLFLVMDQWSRIFPLERPGLPRVRAPKANSLSARRGTPPCMAYCRSGDPGWGRWSSGRRAVAAHTGVEDAADFSGVEWSGALLAGLPLAGLFQAVPGIGRQTVFPERRGWLKAPPCPGLLQAARTEPQCLRVAVT